MSVLAGRIAASPHCNPPAQEVTLKVMVRSTISKVDVRADGIGLSGNLQRLRDLRDRDPLGQHLVRLAQLPNDLLRTVSPSLHAGPPLAHSTGPERLSHAPDGTQGFAPDAQRRAHS